MDSRPNFFIYSESKLPHTAASLIAFGYDVYSKSKIIKEIDSLKRVLAALNIRPESKDSYRLVIIEFMLEYLIDSIRILIFFENYMKARLILKGFVVHSIKDEDPFKSLRKKQFKEPILYRDIHEIEPFVFENDEFHSHRFISDKTIGFSTLMGNQYTKYYNIDVNLLKFIGELNKYRNTLHFKVDSTLKLSDDFVLRLSELKEFVNKVMLQFKMKS